VVNLGASLGSCIGSSTAVVTGCNLRSVCCAGFIILIYIVGELVGKSRTCVSFYIFRSASLIT